MMFMDTPSRAISTAWAWRSWCGAKRRRTPALTARRRSWVRTEGADHGCPVVGPRSTQKNGPTGSPTRCSSQGRSCCQPHSSMPTSRRRPPASQEQGVGKQRETILRPISALAHIVLYAERLVEYVVGTAVGFLSSCSRQPTTRGATSSSTPATSRTSRIPRRSPGYLPIGSAGSLDHAPPLREDGHGMPGLLQCVEGRSNGELNRRVDADPCHARMSHKAVSENVQRVRGSASQSC